MERFGGQRVEGVYILRHVRLDLYYAVAHSVWQDLNGDLIDITPFEDKRDSNFFLPIKINRRSMLVQSLADINNRALEQETELTYYVYAYFDKSDKLPFYIGKGSGSRDRDHLIECRRDTSNNRFYNKLKTMLEQNQTPKIVRLAAGLITEDEAYQIEEEFITFYGRKGYELGGVLLNTCPNAKPPNHRGRTYEDIYGDRADEQREKRRKVQLERGGFGPKKFSPEVRAKLSAMRTGPGNVMYGRHHTPETKLKISEANKGQKRYHRSMLYVIEGLPKFTAIYSNELDDFCAANGYSASTFRSQLDNNWPSSRKGKNKGLRIRKATAEEQVFHSNK